ncbi:phage terminase large subunit (GpA) [Escherichia coli]|uniref:Phage terminase large subunit (GpA) n=2 Tax=Escherichia coli TaxID=562 RepID=A0A377EQZ0_ECOLX|nr:phage terminase large subunit (GpA) [Escherichia coli]
MVKLFIRDQKNTGVFRVLPVKGASVYGKPVITMPKPAISGACICVKWERTPQKKFSMPYESRSLACG